MTASAQHPVASSPSHSCELSRSSSYVEALTLRPAIYPSQSVELVITSQLLTARLPDERWVRHRAHVSREALLEMRRTIDLCLASDTAQAHSVSL